MNVTLVLLKIFAQFFFSNSWYDSSPWFHQLASELIDDSPFKCVSVSVIYIISLMAILFHHFGEGQLIFWYSVHPQAFFEESGGRQNKKKISKWLFNFWVGIRLKESVEKNYKKKERIFYIIRFNFLAKNCLYRWFQYNCIPCPILQTLIGEPFLWDQ